MLILMDDRRSREYRDIDTRLADIVQRLQREVPYQSIRAYVTSIYRTPAEDAALGGSGIHACSPPYRAIDIEIPPTVTDIEAVNCAKKLNVEWAYDPDRPHLRVAVEDIDHGTGKHWHLQIHPHTKRRLEL
jgi:hypothetical protein